MMTDHPCRSDLPIGLMFDLDETDPFVGVPIADFHPAQGGHDRRCDHLGGVHSFQDRCVRDPVKFLAVGGVSAHPLNIVVAYCPERSAAIGVIAVGTVWRTYDVCRRFVPCRNPRSPGGSR